MRSSIRVAMFTPLPPARTGTAEYARAVVDELGKLVNLEVFESVPKRFNNKAFDAVIYQIANNPHHADFYERALDHPGRRSHLAVRGLPLPWAGRQ